MIHHLPVLVVVFFVVVIVVVIRTNNKIFLTKYWSGCYITLSISYNLGRGFFISLVVK